MNTRPLEQGKTLTAAVENAGGEVIVCPMLQINPLTDWQNDLLPLNRYDQAIFTSSNAVDHFFNYVDPTTWPLSIKTAAIGLKTAGSLQKKGIRVNFTPQQMNSEGLLETWPFTRDPGLKLILITGQGGLGLIEKSFQGKVNLTKIAVYQRVKPIIQTAFLDKIWQEKKVDIILLTSFEAMANLFSLFGPLFAPDAQQFLRKRPCLVISPRLASAALSMGIETVIQTAPHTLMEALYQFKKDLLNGHSR